MNHHRLTHSTWEEGRGRGEGGRGGGEGAFNHMYYSTLQTDTTFPSLKGHIYMHTYNVLNDCMLTFTPAKTMFLAGEERKVELSTY